MYPEISRVGKVKFRTGIARPCTPLATSLLSTNIFMLTNRTAFRSDIIFHISDHLNGFTASCGISKNFLRIFHYRKRIFLTLKSDRVAIRSSSSLVAEDAPGPRRVVVTCEEISSVSPGKPVSVFVSLTVIVTFFGPV